MDFDIVIVGAGLVGAAFARAMKDSNLRMALIESSPPQVLPDDDSWDSRIYAISPGSKALLSDLGIWRQLDQSRIQPVHEMRIWGDDNQSRLDFNAYDAGMAELAMIAESRLLQIALWRSLEGQENIRLFCPAECTSVIWEPERVVLQLKDGMSLRTRLLVGADGARSWVREQAGIEANPKPYHQFGVVANFATEKPHGNVARQWFRKDGVLAYLPLPGNRISIVWSTFEGHANELMALPEQEFCARVRGAGGGALGLLQLITPPAAFPLRLLRLDQLIKPRLALIGDAAHNVHPLAGQGVNLGFQDAEILAGVLSRPAARQDCGDYFLLRRYERARKEDILAMQTVTDGLQKLFNNDSTILGALRNFGLQMTNKQGWLKKELMNHAFGRVV
jgi:2-octaprenylphenol hydroxylase